MKLPIKKILLIPAACLLAVFLWNCEKDDICDSNTPTTPRLVVEFYDVVNPTVLKNVSSLTVLGDGMNDTLATFNGQSKILLPLKTTQAITKYKFILNSNNAAIDNVDYLEFHYISNQVFVSRACGYKTVFALDSALPVTLTDTIPADELWMQNVTVSQPNIATENETHVKVYF